MPDFRNAIFRVATKGTGPDVRAPAAYRRACLLEASYPLGVELSRCRQPRAAGASTKGRRSLFLLVDNAERKHSPTSRDSEAEGLRRPTIETGQSRRPETRPVLGQESVINF